MTFQGKTAIFVLGAFILLEFLGGTYLGALNNIFDGSLGMSALYPQFYEKYQAFIFPAMLIELALFMWLGWIIKKAKLTPQVLKTVLLIVISGLILEMILIFYATLVLNRTNWLM